jgi:hypothetical protein
MMEAKETVYLLLPQQGQERITTEAPIRQRQVAGLELIEQAVQQV